MLLHVKITKHKFDSQLSSHDQNCCCCCSGCCCKGSSNWNCSYLYLLQIEPNITKINTFLFLNSDTAKANRLCLKIRTDDNLTALALKESFSPFVVLYSNQMLMSRVSLQRLMFSLSLSLLLFSSL